MKIAIVGMGNMGSTFANGFINSRFINPTDVLIYTRSKKVLEDNRNIHKLSYRYELDSGIATCDIVILAVKPQDFSTLADDLKKFIHQDQIIVSVMAGVSIDRLKKDLLVTKIVRSMPNLPTQIGKGMTVFTASEELDRKELFIIQNLINTTGKSVYVLEEHKIDAATAISGSGPAYVFYFMEAMIQAAISYGFEPSQAELLVKQTISGALGLYEANSLSTQDWIAKVSSKGGTTEQAIKYFNEEDILQKLVEGVNRAKAQSELLGKQTK
ncbi:MULTISPECIES: pyrroline-5-carboxylate reductase [Myroides]|uniref:Pyrroline-5-carboxylate reductase n=1 Tax=Myroides albus TaxID=2562892 RepID=A0A6I3LG33_9FLAO|nr:MULTISPECIES: pyrroline-5-carboxylate reductase [Myroides]MTG97438.1 pyrroline-5-carboxylate reductase [Myroides albus]MVX36771.1 pyrroline-5-carboxylate reductase [Myroides sp. LoEW2-1]UVD79471.1 pyrroline-5-carboxylate reductase [Myroides albus]